MNIFDCSCTNAWEEQRPICKRIIRIFKSAGCLLASLCYIKDPENHFKLPLNLPGVASVRQIRHSGELSIAFVV